MKMTNQVRTGLAFNGHNNSNKEQGFNKDKKNSFKTNEDSEDFFEEYIVLLSNILTAQLNESDIELLLNSFLDAHNFSYSNSECTIDSVQVFMDCMYLVFFKEREALNAVKFFNNFEFKSHRIQASLIDNKDLFIDLNSIFEKHTNSSEDKEILKNFSEIDCEILVATRQSKSYADSLNEKLCKELLGINTHIRYLCDESTEANSGVDMKDDLKNLLQGSIKKNLLYVIQIDQTCQQFNSINLLILNQWRNVPNELIEEFNYSGRLSKILSKKKNLIKENRNMPLNKALEQLKDDYCDFITFIKAKESAAAQSRKVDHWSVSDLKESVISSFNAKNSKFNKLSSLLKFVLDGCGGDREKQRCSYKIKDLELLKISLEKLKKGSLKVPDFEYNPEKKEQNSSKPPVEFRKPQPLMPSTSSLLPLPQPLLAQPLLNPNLPQPLMLSQAKNYNFHSQKINTTPLMTSVGGSITPYIAQQQPQQIPLAYGPIRPEHIQPLLPRFHLSNYNTMPNQTNQAPRSLMDQTLNMSSLMSIQSNHYSYSNNQNNKKTNNTGNMGNQDFKR